MGVSEPVFAVRRLVAAPVFTVLSLLVLACGLSAVIGAYSILHLLFWKPLGFADPERLVDIRLTSRPSDRNVMSWPDFQQVRMQQRTLTSLAASQWFRVAFSDGAASEVVLGEAVSGEYFRTLGVGAIVGRTIVSADERLDGGVVVLSRSFWLSRFTADPAVIGRTVQVAGIPLEIVGVAGEGFDGLERGIRTALWIPIPVGQQIPIGDRLFLVASGRDAARLSVKGRLKPEMQWTHVASEVALIGRQIDANERGTSDASGRQGRRTWSARPYSTYDVDVWRFSLPAAAVACIATILLLVCANVGNMTLGRLVARRHELSIRAGLGASRWRLIREQLLETTVLVGVGTVLAYAATASLIPRVLEALPADSSPLVSADLDVWSIRALPVTLASVLGSIALCGLLPVWQFTRPILWAGLVSEAGATPHDWRLQRRLVVLQVAGSVALLLVAATFAMFIWGQAQTDSGVDTESLAILQLDFGLNGKRTGEARAILNAVLDKARTQPGIESVAASVGIPFGLQTPSGRVSRIDQPLQDPRYSGEPVYIVSGTADLLKTLGVRIVRGRPFLQDETDRTVLLSESLARRVFGVADVVGRAMLLRRWDSHAIYHLDVVGITADTDGGRVGSRNTGVIYLPYDHKSDNPVIISARASSGASRALSALHMAMRNTDPRFAVTTAGTGERVLKRPYIVVRVLAHIVAALGIFALGMAMTGLYAMLAHAMRARTREFGIRMAVGADWSTILKMVLVDGLRPVADGLALGIIAALIGRLVIRTTLVLPVAATEATTILVVSVALFGAAVSACIGPALSAARTEPHTVLRHL